MAQEALHVCHCAGCRVLRWSLWVRFERHAVRYDCCPVLVGNIRVVDCCQCHYASCSLVIYRHQKYVQSNTCFQTKRDFCIVLRQPVTSTAISKSADDCYLVLYGLVDLAYWCEKHWSDTGQGPGEFSHLHKVEFYSFLVIWLSVGYKKSLFWRQGSGIF